MLFGKFKISNKFIVVLLKWRLGFVLVILFFFCIEIIIEMKIGFSCC